MGFTASARNPLQMVEKHDDSFKEDDVSEEVKRKVEEKMFPLALAALVVTLLGPGQGNLILLAMLIFKDLKHDFDGMAWIGLESSFHKWIVFTMP